MNDIFSLGELFEQVQLSNIFSDGKTFVDCTPRSDFSFIRQRYDEEKMSPDFNLASFIDKYFIFPKSYAEHLDHGKVSITEHINRLWPELTRQPIEEEPSLIPLPYPYIVPGGRFREIFYWDSYFTMLGLKVSRQYELMQNMVDNFSYLIDKFGYIPNGNRTYFLGRSQPPFYAMMVKLLASVIGENTLIKYLPQLEKEYNFWMRGAGELNSSNVSAARTALMPDGSILNHYWDESDTPRPESFKEDMTLAGAATDQKALFRNIRAACESGWDFSSRWFKNQFDFATIHTTEIIPVDLNCLLYDLEKTISTAYRLSNDNALFEQYNNAASKRVSAINKYCWNEKHHCFYDYEYVSDTQKESVTAATTFPLFFKIATASQAEGVAAMVDKHLLRAGGLQTTTFETGQQWDSPNGWAPLQWIAFCGFKNYGLNTANQIIERWTQLNEKVFESTGKMMEKYNVVDTNCEAGGGEYASQDGFGWTNGVYLALKEHMNKQD